MPTLRADEPHDAADALNSLLRGEIAAVETYVQALKRVDHGPEAAVLGAIRDDHVAAANLLRRYVAERDANNATSSGAWGAFAKAVEGGAALLGNALAIKALRQGEELGVRTYEAAVDRPDLDPIARAAVKKSLLPRQRTHVPALDTILGGD
jgi:hypothetical protein